MFKSLVYLWAIVQLSAYYSVAEGADRIVGGREVSISKHPHQISLRRKSCSDCEYNHFCGGSIYNERVVITAAHCVTSDASKPGIFAIVAGSDNRKGSDGAIVRVESIKINEEYGSYGYHNDIALMFLSQSLPINNVTIRAIPLASRVPITGERAVVSGWGDTTHNGHMSLKLHEVELPIVDRTVCIKAYGANKIKDNMICAGLVGEGGKDSCQGDSGGPLIVNNELAGIVSWGRGCAFPEYPGVYSNVFNLRKWIEDTIQNYNSTFSV